MSNSVSFNKGELEKFPKSPGVYIMKGEGEKILYVGKAKNIKARVKQYFSSHPDERAMIPHLVAQVCTIDTIIVFSEKEALILENTLIKKHKPKYNALLKDDKSYFSLEINPHDLWPMVKVVRYKRISEGRGLLFGPYTQGHSARETLEILRRLFPLRQCSDRELVSRKRPCILYDMKRCIAPCVAKCTKEEYDTAVSKLISFLKGHDLTLLKELRGEMEKASAQLEFEKAEAILRTIQHIEATLEKQKIEKATFDDMNAIGIARKLDEVVVTELFFREGKLIGSSNHRFSYNAEEDDELLSSFLLQAYQGQIDLPKIILLPIELQDQDALSAILQIELHNPKKGDKKELILMAQKNATATLERVVEERDLKEKVLISLEEECKLTNYPEKIECFDNSNMAGAEPVSAQVVFIGGQKATKYYRKYKIAQATASDDYEALREALTRRYKKAKEEDNLPDLLLIDGGRGHLNIAHAVLESLNISTVDLIAISKEESKHTKGLTQEKIFLIGAQEPLVFKTHSPILLFLQEIRDEAHRFALTFQRKRRGKKLLTTTLLEIPGIGEIKSKRLLIHFGSLKRVLAASKEDLKEVKGITKQDIQRIEELKARQEKREP